MKYKQINYGTGLNSPIFGYTLRGDGHFELRGGDLFLKDKPLHFKLPLAKMKEIEALLEAYNFPSFPSFPSCKERDVHPNSLRIETESGEFLEYKNIFYAFQMEFDPKAIEKRLDSLLYSDIEIMEFDGEWFKMNLPLRNSNENRSLIINCLKFFFELENILEIRKKMDPALFK